MSELEVEYCELGQLFPEIDMACDGLVVWERDGVIVHTAHCLQEGKVEPLGPDHAGPLGLKENISITAYVWRTWLTFFLWKM